MTQDEIISMARDAGFVVQIHGECFGHTTLEHRFNPDRLEAFAALVAAYEREACAKVCEEHGPKEGSMRLISDGFAAAIRARGLK